jgi:hypothetical protein
VYKMALNELSRYLPVGDYRWQRDFSRDEARNSQPADLVFEHPGQRRRPFNQFGANRNFGAPRDRVSRFSELELPPGASFDPHPSEQYEQDPAQAFAREHPHDEHHDAHDDLGKHHHE